MAVTWADMFSGKADIIFWQDMTSSVGLKASALARNTHRGIKIRKQVVREQREPALGVQGWLSLRRRQRDQRTLRWQRCWSHLPS